MSSMNAWAMRCDVPSRGTRRLGEPVARQRRGDHMEGVAGPATVGLGVGQPGDDVEELDHRARPAVDEQQGQGIGVGRPGVHEMDRLAVDGGPVVLEAVQAGLLCPPVVGVAPVLDQLA